MYVLVDMEWISNQRGNHWPTQLAAARVDAHWNTVDTLSTLFRPKDFSFQQWGHMAFSGWNKEQFLNGESLYAGLDAFRHWLQPEDTICWWHQEASDLFNMFSKVSGVPDMTQHVVLLCDYIYGYLAGQEASVGSPYKICAARNIATPSPAHCSANDVATMQLLAQGIGFEQKHLLEPPKRWGNDAMAQKGSSAYKLLYDPQAKLLHQSDCKLLPDNRHFPAFLTFKLPLRRKYTPCSCCNVVIFRLPVPVPDPIIEYKCSIAKDALMDVRVPEMIIKLKQGIGRLIRNFTDTGIVCIIDRRLRDNPPERYHDITWDSLPIKNRTSSLDELRRFYESLPSSKG